MTYTEGWPKRWIMADDGYGQEVVPLSDAERLEKERDNLKLTLEVEREDAERLRKALTEQTEKLGRAMQERDRYRDRYRELREALERIAQHKETCNADLHGSQPCLWAVVKEALDALDALHPEEPKGSQHWQLSGTDYVHPEESE